MKAGTNSHDFSSSQAFHRRARGSRAALNRRRGRDTEALPCCGATGVRSALARRFSARRIEVACQALEDDPSFNAGTGAGLNADGDIELDASIMNGEDLSAGAIAVVRTLKNPISGARRVMEDSPHVLLVGAGAEDFVHSRGVPRVDPHSLITPSARARWLARRGVAHGTIGAVACDVRGHVAAGTSTGGTSGKLKGRVGDSPLIGCGTIADDRWGAVSCTGAGEAIIRVGLARTALENLRRGELPRDAALRALEEVRRLALSGDRGDVGLILVTPDGRVAWAQHSERMSRAWVTSTAEGVGFLGDS